MIERNDQASIRGMKSNGILNEIHEINAARVVLIFQLHFSLFVAMIDII